MREHSYWDGDQWVEATGAPIAVKGLNSFRFRWVIELDENLERATVPIEAELRPSWDDGGDGPPPDESEIADASLEIASVYPVEEPQTSESLPQTPYVVTADDALIPQGYGSYAVAGILDVLLESDAVDPEATIEEIATKHGGVVVGAVEDLGIYELRFDGYDLDQLKELGVAIEASDDVSFAGPHFVSELDPDF